MREQILVTLKPKGAVRRKIEPSSEWRRAMRIVSWMSAFLAQLCRIFDVTPASITRDRRGNLPPPSGGVSSF
jgi:hypothetical protein